MCTSLEILEKIMWLNLLYTMLTLLALALIMLGIHNATNIWRFLIVDIAGGVAATIAFHAVLDLDKDTWLSNTLLVIFCAWTSYLLWQLGTAKEGFATYEERVRDQVRFVPQGTAGNEDFDEGYFDIDGDIEEEEEEEDDAEEIYTFEVITGGK